MSDSEPDTAPEDVVGTETNVTEDGGIVKKIIKAGTGWKTPTKGSDVTGL
jgi:hypothetical protein